MLSEWAVCQLKDVPVWGLSARDRGGSEGTDFDLLFFSDLKHLLDAFQSLPWRPPPAPRAERGGQRMK